VVLGVGLPVIYIDLWETGDEKLELLLIKDGDELSRNDFMEACTR